MASLVRRAFSSSSSVDRGSSSSLFRLSFNFLGDRFSTSATAAADAAPAAAGEAKKPKRKKQKNLFEVAQFLPNWGVGYHMAKSHWKGVSYQITKINLYKDGRHGKAWGIVHKDGLPPADAPKKISGVHKRCWKYIKNSNTTEATASTTPKLIKAEETTPKVEVETV